MLAQRLPDIRIIGAAIAVLGAGVAIGFLAIGGGAPVVSPPTIHAAVPPPEPAWSRTALNQLLAAVESSRDEGLRPSDYQHDALAAMVRDETGAPRINPLAEAAARSLAHDFAGGRVASRKRVDWHIASPPALATLNADLDEAVRTERVDSYLRGLLPQDARYKALREALRDVSDDSGRRAHIRASMERWRWMPRTLGPDYVFVNIPSYQVALFKADTVVATHDVVVGAPKRPTPMLSANVGSIIINPWWTLPPTVLREGKRYSPARGYVYQTIHGKTYVRQKPGPMNALGRVKIEFPNPYAIYLHDTPAKSAFERSDRALSHGCIRVKGIETLAAEIGDPTAVQTALDRRYTQTLSIQRTLPVYIVYFTAAPAADGTVEMLPDPYGRDAGVVAALDAPNPALPTTAVAAAQPAAVMQGL